MDLAAELQRQAVAKKDFLADTRALTARATGGGIVLDGINGGLEIQPTAHAQLADALAIPRTYYDRLLTASPDLLAENVNHWLHAEPARKLVRTLDGKARAFLSDRYRPLDNFDLAEAVLPKLTDLGARVESAEVTDRRFYLKAVTDRIQGAVKPGDIIQAGIVVSNSEIGHGSLKIEELDFRLVCTNGMIRAQAIRRAHLGRMAVGNANVDLLEAAQEFFRDETRQADDRAFWLKVQDTVAAMFNPERFAKRIEEYKDASERHIEGDPVKAVEAVSRRLGLAKEEGSSVLQHLIRGGDLSAWGLANAITYASQQVGDYERATELEAIGGQVIELPASEWNVITAAK